MTPTSDNSKPLPGSTLLETSQKNLPPIPVTIAGVLHHGHTLCAGPPKLGKTYLATQLALAVASGEPALGALEVRRRGPVLYLALEDGERRLKARTAALLGGTAPAWLGDIRVIYELPHSLDTQQGMDWLKDVLKSQPWELLIIATYVKAFPSDSRTRDLFKGEYKQMDTLTKLAEQHDLAVLTIAHTRKPGKDEDGGSLISVAGTGGRTAAADAVLMLSGRQGKATAKLNVISRDTEGLELTLTRNPATSGWTATPPAASIADAKLSAGKTKILDLLAHKGPLTRSGIEHELPTENGVSIGTWLFRLVQKDHQVVKLGGTHTCYYGLPGQVLPEKKAA